MEGMAAADAVVYAVKGQQLRLSGWMFNRLSGHVFENVGVLTATISKDAGAFAATSATPVEVDTGGLVYIDLTDAEMSAYTVAVKIVAADENATQLTFIVVTLDLAETAGHWRAGDPIRLEQLFVELGAQFFNKQDRRFADGRLRNYAYGGATVLATRSFAPSSDESHEERGEAS